MSNQAIKQYPPVLNLHAVKEMTSLCKSSVYKLVNAGEFPAPKKLFSNRVVWSTAEVLDWLNGRMEGAK